MCICKLPVRFLGVRTDTDDFSASLPSRLGQAAARDLSTVKLELRKSRFRLENEGAGLGGWHALPEYRPGHIVLGVVDDRSGDAPLKIDSIQVKTVVN